MEESPEPSPRRVVSIDPGTRNIGICCVADTCRPGLDVTMQDFLSGLELTNLSLEDLGTNHIETCCFAFRNRLRADGSLSWIRETMLTETPTNVVIERQANPQASATYLMHAVAGMLMAMRLNDNESVFRIQYEAASKFRGDYIYAPAKDGVATVLAASQELLRTTGDPVKQAAVELCQRLFSWFKQTPLLTRSIATVRAEHRQHDMCDCVLQAVSWLYRARFGKGREAPLTAITSDDRVLTTEEMLKLPRKGRRSTGATRTTAVRAAAKPRAPKAPKAERAPKAQRPPKAPKEPPSDADAATTAPPKLKRVRLTPEQRRERDEREAAAKLLRTQLRAEAKAAKEKHAEEARQLRMQRRDEAKATRKRRYEEASNAMQANDDDTADALSTIEWIVSDASLVW